VIIMRTFKIALLVLLCASGPAFGIGEQLGRIRGRVYDASSHQPIQGATISARSGALIGGARTSATDKLGRFELPSLPAGVYNVEVGIEGMAPLLRKAVVTINATTDLQIPWSLETAGVETVAVVDRRPLTRPDSTQTGAVMEADLLNDLPTGRSYQNASLLVPGVTGGANPNIRGGLDLNNHYLIDGLDVTDPVTGTFSTNLSFDATDAVEVLTGGMEAQYNSLAGIINVISRPGSGNFRANVSGYLNHPSLSADANTGPNIYDGIQPFNKNSLPQTQSYQANANVGGPILRDRLWAQGSYELRIGETFTPKAGPLGIPPYNIQHPGALSISHLARLNVTYVPTAGHRVTVSGGLAPGVFNNTAGGNSSLGVAENRQNQGSFWAIASWLWPTRGAVTPNLQVGYLNNFIETGPQGRLGSVDFTGCDQFKPDNCFWLPDRQRHTNLVDNTVWYQGTTYQMDRRSRLQIDPSVSVRGHLAGTHDAKIGLQLQYNHRTRDVAVPGGSTYRDQGDASTTLESGLCDPTAPNPVGCYLRIDSKAYSAHQNAYGAGFYLQDRWWTPLSWLTLNPGIRFDYGRTTDRLDRVVTSMFTVGPRIGADVDLFGDASTVLFAYYGRHTDVLSLLPASNADATEAAESTTWGWDATVHQFSNVVSKSGGPGGVQIDHQAKAPHKDEVSAGVRRALGSNGLVSLTYSYDRISNLWAGVEINRIWDPTGTRVVGWVDPNHKDLDISLFTTPDSNHRTYQGFELYGEVRPTPNIFVSGSYDLSWTYGPANTVFGQNANFSQYDNLRLWRFFDGYEPQDQRHTLRFTGTYRLFGHLTLGGIFSYATGIPLTKAFFTVQDGGYFNLRTPLGTQPSSPNDPNAVSEFRVPERATMDIRVVYNLLPRSTGQQLNLIADIFNAVASRGSTSITTNDIPTFGQSAGRTGPLRVQLAINYRY
jgi:hypothetical protein